MGGKPGVGRYNLVEVDDAGEEEVLGNLVELPMLSQLRPGLGLKLVVELHLIVLRVVSEDNHFIFELLQALLVVDPNKNLELPTPKQFLTWLGQQEPSL